MKTIFQKILATIALCLAAGICVSCEQMKSTLPEYGLGDLSSELTEQEKLTREKNADITIIRTDEGEVAYLVQGDIVCQHAAAVAKRLRNKKKPVNVHISFLLSPSMIIETVQPLLDAGLHQISSITIVNNQTHEPFVYAIVPIDKNSCSAQATPY